MNNNQSRSSYPPSSNQNQHSRRPYSQPQSSNQTNQSSLYPINHSHYPPNNQISYGNSNNMQNNYGNNYYYPYPYGHYNPHQPHPYGPSHLYMQPTHYLPNCQQVPPNVPHLGYKQQAKSFAQQYQVPKYNQSQAKKNQFSQSNQRLQQMTPNKRAREKSNDFQTNFEKQGYYSNNNRTLDKKQSNYNQQAYQDKEIQINSYSSASESEEEQEEVFYKKKQILKKRDPVLDSKEEIRKWIEARKRNYPRKNVSEQEQQKKSEQQQLSILEKKIRKKIVLINSDPKSILKKQKDLDILRRFMIYPRRPRKQPKYQYQRKEAGPLVQQIVENQPKQLKLQIQIAPENTVHQQQEVIENNVEVKDVEINEQDDVVQLPIKSNNNAIQAIEKSSRTNDGIRNRREELSVDVIVKHLQMKQKEDSKVLSNLMDYKTNSFNYRYQHQTLETNLMLQNIFKDTSYMLQAIRHIVKNNFFD